MKKHNQTKAHLGTCLFDILEKELVLKQIHSNLDEELMDNLWRIIGCNIPINELRESILNETFTN